MKYISTRGGAPQSDFEKVLLDGLAPDGGLYVPETWPVLSPEAIKRFGTMPFFEVAAHVIDEFVGDCISLDDLLLMSERAYATFNHAETVPARKLNDHDWLLELYHGPTLAFKDVAMQFLGQLFDHVLQKKNRRVTIVGATSGDTGAAAIEAFKGLERVDLFILHPKGRVSEVQRRIMTSVDDPNVYNISVDGTFDDCQKIVKDMFADRALTERLSLGGVNSINWVRLAIQSVYYFTSAHSVANANQPVSFIAPTGNFGDIFAGYVAKKMGLPIGQLGIAVNENDILHRTLTTGRYHPACVQQTSTPSMDIQVASNFERLIFEASQRDPAAVLSFVRGVATPVGATLPAGVLANIQSEFVSERASNAEIKSTISETKKETGFVIDPHTAVAVVALNKMRAANSVSGPAVVLSTAHPAKFPETVEEACGEHPNLPAQFGDLYDRPEYCLLAANDIEEISSILLKNARIVR